MSSYRRHYDIEFLDDLHNYFPELLYGPVEQFRSVADVLLYMRSQVRRRFDLFSSGQATYDHTYVVDNRTNNISAAGGAAVAGGLRTPPARLPLSSPPPIQRMNSFYPLNTNTGLSPLQLFTYLIEQNQTVLNTPEFMEPVIVRPTRQQIEEGTSIETVAADENGENICAICQDDMDPGSQARRFNVCDHRFHRTCIETWFQRDVRCPTCRHDVREQVVDVPAAAATAPTS